MNEQSRILFRGKRTDNGQWVEGGFLSFQNNRGAACYIIPQNADWVWRSNLCVLERTSPCYEVDPITVGRYTGLTDASGVQIFDGDIVLDKESGYRYQVKWFQEQGCFAYANRAGHMEFEYTDAFCDDMVVIGNIYDGRELL